MVDVAASSHVEVGFSRRGYPVDAGGTVQDRIFSGAKLKR